MKEDQEAITQEEKAPGENPRRAGKSFIEMDLTASDSRLFKAEGWGRNASPQFSKVRYEIYWRSTKDINAELIMVCMDFDNSVKVKDAIEQTILAINKEIINRNIDCEILLPDSSCYEYRLASRNGQPKMDYPALDPVQRINMTGFSNRLFLLELERDNQSIMNTDFKNQLTMNTQDCSIASTKDTDVIHSQKLKNKPFMSSNAASSGICSKICCCFFGTRTKRPSLNGVNTTSPSPFNPKMGKPKDKSRSSKLKIPLLAD